MLAISGPIPAWSYSTQAVTSRCSIASAIAILSHWRGLSVSQGKKLHLVRGDIRDRAALLAALRESGASAVIHFAGLKAVGESVQSATGLL